MDNAIDNVQFEDKLPDRYVCPLCKKVLKDPLQTSCGHIFLFEMLESFRKVSQNVYCRVSFTLSYVFIVNFVACYKRSAWRLINVPSTLSFCSRVFQWSVKHEKSRLRIYYFSIRWFTFTFVIGGVFAKWDVSLNISESVLFTASLNDFKLTVVKL